MHRLLPASLATLAMTVALSGCGGCESDPDPPHVPLPRIEGIEFGEVRHLTIDEELVVELRLTAPDGQPALNELEWVYSDAFPAVSTVVTENPAPGVHRMRVTTELPGAFHVSAWVFGGTPAAPESKLSNNLIAIRYGGEPVGVVPTTPALALVVGERRPALGIPLARADGRGTTSHLPVTYEIADPTVATVDAHGLVSALAVGTTTLTLRHGTTSATVPVEVAAGALAPPPLDAQVAYFPTYPAGPRARFDVDGFHGTMQIDERGYPAVVTMGVGVIAPYTTGAVTLASWTGSGVGFERVSTVPVLGREPRFVIDDTGRQWVVYEVDDHDGVFVVADRPAGAGPGTWRYRRLDISNPATAGTKPDYASVRTFPAYPLSVLARPGGGIYVAYGIIHDETHADALVYTDCVEYTRLAELTDTDHRTYEVTSARELSPDVGDCSRWSGSHENDRPYELVRRPGELPDVLGLTGAGLTRFRHAGGTWSPTVLVPAETETLLPGIPLRDLRYMTVARGSGGAADVIFAAYFEPETPTRAAFYQVVGVDTVQGSWTWGLGLDDTTLRGIFAFRTGDRVFQGISLPWGPRWLSPFDGGLFMDDLVGAFGFDGAGPARPTLGLTSFVVDGERLNMLSDTQLYTVRLPRAPDTATTSELIGTRLGAQRRTPRVIVPPLVLGDGRRVVISEAEPAAEADFDPDPSTMEHVRGAIHASSAPGAPWQVVAVRDGGGSRDVVDRIWEIPGGLYTLRRRTTADDISMLRSTDGGATWLAWGSIATTQPVLASAFTPAGRGYLVVPSSSTSYQVWHAAAIQDGPLYTATAQRPTTPDNGARFDEGDAGVVVSGSNVYVLSIAPRANGGTAHDVLVQRLDASGVAQASFVIGLPVGTSSWVRLDRASVTGTGRIVIPVYGDTIGHPAGIPPLRTIWIDPSSQQIGLVTFADLTYLDFQLVRLSDGRVALAHSRHTARGTREVVLRTTSDGATWSAPAPVRPTGGNLQSVAGIAAEPGGGLLAVVGDNQGLAVAGGPPVDVLVVRVAAP